MLRESWGVQAGSLDAIETLLYFNPPPHSAHILSLFSSKVLNHLSDGCSTDSARWRVAEAGGTPEVPEHATSTSLCFLVL